MGHRSMSSFDGQSFHYFTEERIETKSLHGTGCTFASAIAAELAGAEVIEAVRRAKAYITTAIRLAEPIGHGFGPRSSFCALYQHAARHDILLQLADVATELRQERITALLPEVQSNLGWPSRRRRHCWRWRRGTVARTRGRRYPVLGKPPVRRFPAGGDDDSRLHVR